VRVYASNAYAEARTGFLRRYRAQLEEMIAKTPEPEKQTQFRDELKLIDSGDLLAPDAVIAESGARSIAGRRLMVHLGR
jgi:hypothetical protein